MDNKPPFEVLQKLRINKMRTTAATITPPPMIIWSVENVSANADDGAMGSAVAAALLAESVNIEKLTDNLFVPSPQGGIIQ